MPTKFKPTQLRGPALAREILTVIEAEQDARFIDDAPKNRWHQQSWARLSIESLPPGTEVEVIDPKLLHRTKSWYAGDYALAFNQGLTCGTAMCFAGHAAHLAGDRMVVASHPDWTDLISEQKTSNWKRTITKARKRFLSLHSGRVRPELEFSAEFVITGDDQRLRTISERARNLLGLTKPEAARFFDAHNTLPELRLYVERMERGENIINGRRKPGRRRVS